MEYNQSKSMKFVQHLISPGHLDKFFLKSWGYEYWFENNDKYCGKLINVRMGEWSSFGAFHYHKLKDETFFIIDGNLILDILDLSMVDTDKIEQNEIVGCGTEEPWCWRYYLGSFEYIRIYPGVLHRFSGYGGEAIFIETSSTHYEQDSFRIKSPDPNDQLEIFPKRVPKRESYDIKIHSYLSSKQYTKNIGIYNKTENSGDQ